MKWTNTAIGEKYPARYFWTETNIGEKYPVKYFSHESKKNSKYYFYYQISCYASGVIQLFAVAGAETIEMQFPTLKQAKAFCYRNKARHYRNKSAKRFAFP